MPEIRVDLKQRIKKTKHTVADAVRASGGELGYQRVSGFMNGLWDLNMEQDKLLRKIIANWEADGARKATVGGDCGSGKKECGE